MKPKITVLVIDDSAVCRKLISGALQGAPDIEVIGTAPDAYVAADKIARLNPDVLTLDIEMPRLDGISFLRKLMATRPMPVVVISSLARRGCGVAIEAMEAGAVEVLAKPGGANTDGDLRVELARKIRSAAQARVRAGGRVMPRRAHPARVGMAGAVVAIGASTGGTEAVRTILESLPANCPPIVIVQHIPGGFSKAFADRLNTLCSFEVKEAVDGDVVAPGRALIAPGDRHLMLRRSGSGFSVEVKTGPPICYQRPSVDLLFRSVAEAAAGKALGILLTGMGKDGALGLLEMRQAGAFTIAQDESSCVVYGMPKEAVRLGAAMRVLPLTAIGPAICGARPLPSKMKPAAADQNFAGNIIREG